MSATYRLRICHYYSFVMKKLVRLPCLVMVLFFSAALMHAQQTDSDRTFFAESKIKAEAGDATNQFVLGTCYGSGRGVEKDAVEAVKWYHKAAEQGYAAAQYNLGAIYATGQGVTKDEAEAVRWYRKAADQGSAAAQFNLGVIYEDGRGIPKNEAEAVQWYCKAADQGFAAAQFILGAIYADGLGVPKDEAEAVRWYRKAADQGNASAQYNLGAMYAKGQGVTKDEAETVRWFRKAAEHGYAAAQYNLGVMYANGQYVTKDEAEAVRWYRKAADQGYASAQYNLGAMYEDGRGVPKDDAEAYKWFLLVGSQGQEDAKKTITIIERHLSGSQRAEGQKLAREWKPRMAVQVEKASTRGENVQTVPTGSGTGFAITSDGYLVSNAHVVDAGTTFKVLTVRGLLSAMVVKVDAANDLALLKVDGNFSALPVTSSRSVKLGATVATVGFPNIGLQGFAPKLARGEIASLTGAGDDARYFQISVPVQPGNSGGALVDERGNVVGVVSAKLSARAALAASGSLPENVNYAVKSSFLLSFLESVPEVAAKLKEPNTKEQKFEDVVKSSEQAAVLVLVY